MNKEDKLKTLVIECGAEFMTAAQIRKLGSDKSDITTKYYKKLKKYINQNYISKQQILNLECLKEENFLLEISKLRVVIDNEHWNYARKFLKDTIEVRNQLREEIKEEIKKL